MCFGLSYAVALAARRGMSSLLGALLCGDGFPRSCRRRFIEVFLLQKTAYRRANGGSTAPSLHEDVDPRFAPDLFVNELSLGQLYTGLWSSVAESRVLGFWRFNVEPQMNIKKCFAMQFS